MSNITTYIPKFLESSTATEIFELLKKEVKWENGIPSRNGFTRKAKAINLNKSGGVTDIVNQLIAKALAQLKSKNPNIPDYTILGVYLNFYRDGKDFTPNHKHDKPIPTDQLVISLGTTRTLMVGKTNYQTGNGDLILFGTEMHGVPKQPEITEGRISIATFMVRKTPSLGISKLISATDDKPKPAPEIPSSKIPIKIKIKQKDEGEQ